MELKDVILSTLAEMEESKPDRDNQRVEDDFRPIIKKELKIEAKSEIPTATQIKEVSSNKEVGVNSEMLFLTSLRERLLVLFEGFQAPNNTNIEAKIDLTLNFLEYVLVTIDTRVEELERGEGK